MCIEPIHALVSFLVHLTMNRFDAQCFPVGIVAHNQLLQVVKCPFMVSFLSHLQVFIDGICKVIQLTLETQT